MFASREEYLSFRADWRRDYKALSADIRAAKRIVRSADECTMMDYINLASLRDRARNMMEYITEARNAARAATAAMRAKRAA